MGLFKKNVPMKKPIIPYKWELLIMLWFAYFLNQGDRQIYAAVLPLIKSDLGLSSAQLGLVVTAFSVVYGCLVPVGGYLGDFMKRKWIVVTSLLVFSIGTMFTGLSTGLVSLIILRGITTGGGEAFYYPAATSLINQYHEKTRAMAMSIHQTSLYVGIIVSGFLAAYIGERLGWRYSFFIFGIGGLLIATYIIFKMKDTPQIKEEHGDNKRIPLKELVTGIFSKKTIWCLCLAFGCQVFVNIGYTTWMATFYHEKFGLALSTASFAAMFFHFSLALVGVLAGGRLSDKLAPKRKTIRMETEFLGLLLGTPFIFVMGWTGSLLVSCAALAMFGFFRGVYDSNLYAAAFDVIDPKYRSSSVGIMTCFAFLVGAVASSVLGIVGDKYGMSVGISMLSAFFLAGSIAIFVAKRFFFNKEYISLNLEPQISQSLFKNQI